MYTNPLSLNPTSNSDLNTWLSKEIPENLSEDDETDFLLDEFFEIFEKSQNSQKREEELTLLLNFI